MVIIQDKYISEYMKNLLNYYNNLRGKENLGTDLFWDAVIISASDVNQKYVYDMQIEYKQKEKEIPLGVPFHVFADPPEYKIGCGGSTMFVLEKLSEIYGNSMSEMRFLLIPAGGYSQRLPSLSILGKLFCPLPFGDHKYQMFDLIMATYLSFLKNMPPGILLASSDAIISYSLLEEDNDSWTFRNQGFTALAHPSPISIGTEHGVYVLPSKDHPKDVVAFMSDCLCVLQKPSINEMHEKGAIVNNCSIDGEDMVYSDSAFFFDYNVATKLIHFYKNHKPLKFELSSYGNFLHPLGLSSNLSLVTNSSDDEFSKIKSELYETLYGTKLSIMVLNNSRFHHLGTMHEYIDSFCYKNKFCQVFPLVKFSNSAFSVKGIFPLKIKGSVLDSIVHPLCNIPESTIVEHSEILVASNIGNNSIVSNARIYGFSLQKLPFEIPQNSLFHTVALKNGYSTIAFSINDDIKKTYKSKSDVMYYGKSIGQFLKYEEMFDNLDGYFSLWTAKIFRICAKPEESFQNTVEIVENIINSKKINLISEESKITCVSAKNILKYKDGEVMFKYQKELSKKISKNKCNFSSEMNSI